MSSLSKKIELNSEIIRFGVFYLLWILVNLPSLIQTYYSHDDASIYVSVPPFDLRSSINLWFPTGRFLVPVYHYLLTIIGIEPYLSTTNTWLSGAFICLAAVVLVNCFNFLLHQRGSAISTLVCLYIIASPLFTEAHYLHSISFYILAIFLSLLAYLQFIKGRVLGAILLNLAALMLFQPSGMLFYLMFLIGTIIQLAFPNYSSQKFSIKKFTRDVLFSSVSFLAYSILFSLSRVVVPNQNAERSLAGSIDQSFLVGKLDLMYQILVRAVTSGGYSSAFISFCVTSLLIFSVAFLYINFRQPQTHLRRNFILLTICLVLLTPISILPLLAVQENWASFRVSMVPAIGVFILCSLPLAIIPREKWYSKLINIFLLSYICLLALHTSTIAAQKALVFQKDQDTIAEIQKLNAENSIYNVQVIASDVTNWNPYFIQGLVLSGTDLLLNSSLDTNIYLDAFLKIAQLGEVVQVNEVDREALVRNYCVTGIRPMTPVLSKRDGITLLCR